MSHGIPHGWAVELSSERKVQRADFAKAAMQGYCAVEAGWNQPAQEVARCSVAMADALLAELEKST